MNTTLSKARLSFGDGILSVQFVENTLIEVEDIIYIYCYGMEKSNRKPYGILSVSYTHLDVYKRQIFIVRWEVDGNKIKTIYT